VKPTSIIFLVVSIILVITGFSVVGVAQGMANTEGIELVNTPDDDAGNYIYRYDYDSDSIGKITVNVKDAKINIIGGAAKPYVELVNFADGMYEFSSANRNLMISNNSDYTKMSGIASLVMNFKGLRSLINYYNISGLQKTVNIYLCADYPVKSVDCRLDSGDIEIRDCTTATDYIAEIGTGNLTVTNVSSTSTLNAAIGTGNVTVDQSSFSAGDFTITTGNVDASAVIKKLTAKIDTGDLIYTSDHSIGLYNIRATTIVGKIQIDGEMPEGSYERNDLPTYDKINVDIGTGDITLTSGNPVG